jgi:hypothetical protein
LSRHGRYRQPKGAHDKCMYQQYGARMIPYSDGIPARRFPIVNTSLIVANFAVWLFYELLDGDEAVNRASFSPCAARRPRGHRQGLAPHPFEGARLERSGTGAHRPRRETHRLCDVTGLVTVRLG